MKSEALNDKLFEAMLEHAVHENWEEYMASLHSDEQLKSLLAYEPSEQFKINMKKLIEKTKKTKTPYHLPAFIKRIAAIFLFILGLASFSLISVPPVYAAIKEFAMRWLPQFSSYEYNVSATDIKAAEWEFTYIPKGYELSTIHFSGDMVDWEYINYDKDEWLLIYSRKAVNGITAVDNEHSDYSQIELNGVKAELYSSNEAESPSYLLWVQDGYAFHIVSYLDENELIKMASSVKIKK